MAAGLSDRDLGTGKLLRGSGMQYAAEKSVREIIDPGRVSDGSCNLMSALQACDACDQSPSKLSSNKSSEGEKAMVGQECPRLRPFKVGDIQIPMTANERWYQNKETVRVLLMVREQGAKVKHVVDAMWARNLLDISYQTMMQKVKMVDEAVAASEGSISAEDIIDCRLQDRPAALDPPRGPRAVAGRRRPHASPVRPARSTTNTSSW